MTIIVNYGQQPIHSLETKKKKNKKELNETSWFELRVGLTLRYILGLHNIHLNSFTD
jgi:hypothetical protein